MQKIGELIQKKASETAPQDDTKKDDGNIRDAEVKDDDKNKS